MDERALEFRGRMHSYALLRIMNHLIPVEDFNHVDHALNKLLCADKTGHIDFDNGSFRDQLDRWEEAMRSFKCFNKIPEEKETNTVKTELVSTIKWTIYDGTPATGPASFVMNTLSNAGHRYNRPDEQNRFILLEDGNYHAVAPQIYRLELWSSGMDDEWRWCSCLRRRDGLLEYRKLSIGDIWAPWPEAPKIINEHA